MATGYLTLQTRTAHDAVPLAGAKITVFDNWNNILYTLTTDESGETGSVALDTLDKRFSQDPGFTGTPYFTYHVLAEAAGFQPLFVSDIPIFDGETATLPLTLTPLRPGARSAAPEKISIGAPAVTLPLTRIQDGRLYEPSRVLRQVVIPNPITVHLGAPASAASNVQVSFPDYVKNVASSEIYPTWPASALTANIYAIITFALNRVYTEW